MIDNHILDDSATYSLTKKSLIIFIAISHQILDTMSLAIKMSLKVLSVLSNRCPCLICHVNIGCEFTISLTFTLVHLISKPVQLITIINDIETINHFAEIVLHLITY